MFGTDTNDWHHQFLNWNFGKYVYKDLEVVNDDSFTHAALFGLPRPDISHIPKKNVVGFTPEPYFIYDLHTYLDYAIKHIGTYFCHDRSDLPQEIFRENIPFLAPFPLHLINNYPLNKYFTMSIIASDKQQSNGHILRHRIIAKILESDMDIHIYGRNLERLYTDPRVKGTIDEKPWALSPYRFTISVENTRQKYYITEKFYDPILFNCIPLYWGASKVEEIFTDDSHINLPDHFDDIWNITLVQNK